MKDFMWMFVSVLIAFVLYTLLAKISISLLLLLNIFSLIVIYYALEKGEIFGALFGAFCGLLQDSFSLGVFGIAGIAKTIMGFTAGYISGKINVTSVRRNFIFILLLLYMELLIWTVLYSFIFSERMNTRGGLIFFQPLITAIVGTLTYRFILKRKRTKM
jgi:rod shape-determining protein MreD